MEGRGLKINGERNCETSDEELVKLFPTSSTESITIFLAETRSDQVLFSLSLSPPLIYSKAKTLIQFLKILLVRACLSSPSGCFAWAFNTVNEIRKISVTCC